MKVIAFVSTVCAILTVAAAYGSYGSTTQPPVITTTSGPIVTPTGSSLPCPKNYLFSCQPNLAPVPCGAAIDPRIQANIRPFGSVSGGYPGAYSGGYPGGHASFGAFSENMPVYVKPVYSYQGLTRQENNVQ